MKVISNSYLLFSIENVEPIEPKPMKKQKSKTGPFVNRNNNPSPQVDQDKSDQLDEEAADNIKDKKKKKRKRKKKKKAGKGKDEDTIKDDVGKESVPQKPKESKYKEHFHECIEKFNSETLLVNENDFESTIEAFTLILKTIYDERKVYSIKNHSNFESHWLQDLKSKIECGISQ